MVLKYASYSLNSHNFFIFLEFFLQITSILYRKAISFKTFNQKGSRAHNNAY